MKDHILKFLTLSVTLWACLTVTGPDARAEITPEDIPAPLQPWTSWVLHGMEDRMCPTDYNNGEAYRCRWPSRISLHIDSNKGRFELEWRVFSPGWVPLPGSPGTWPGKVTVNREPVEVLNRNKRPSVRLPPGRHMVRGRFEWSRMPEMLQIPPETGLVRLFINDREADAPVIDANGRLWLQKQAEKPELENRTNVRIFRLIDDSIPMTVTSHLDISISGQAREITLDGLLPGGSIPMKLDSPLPARFDPEGRLLIQARPGRWTVRIHSRFSSQVDQLGPGTTAYGPEIWSFQSRNDLRMVTISGVQPVEPKRTDMPNEWKQLPAWLLKKGDIMRLKTIRRGDPDPAPDRLTLHRTWWLDFDGTGYTVHDRISGTMSRQWSLWMNPPAQLGRVSVDGKDRLITAQGKDAKPGVELRRGQLLLEADSRFDASRSQLPAVGWDHEFQEVKGELNLPPGWRIFSARGTDIHPGTWLQQWSLLDFFIVLILSLAIGKLKNRIWGLIALVTLTFIYHEPGSPRLVWISIVAALALSRALPHGRFRTLVHVWAGLSVAALLVISIPFMVHQIRTGMYPQLENVRPVPRPAYTARQQAGRPQVLQEKTLPASRIGRDLMSKTDSISEFEDAEPQESRKKTVMSQDPDALIQTGPGLPTWRWNAYRLTWNGPVHRSQVIHLRLLSPLANLILAVARVLLLAVLILGFLDIKAWRQFADKLLPAASIAVLAAVLIIPRMSFAQSAVAEFPPPEILNQLQDRLLEKPDCLPDCAAIERMYLTATPEQIRIRLKVHAACDTAVPMPAALNSWLPQRVMLDNQPAKGLLKSGPGKNPGLWALIPQGIHDVVLQGTHTGIDTVHIPLSLKPQHATADVQGWKLRGIRPDGRCEDAIQLSRIETGEKKPTPVNNGVLPAFVHVRRTLHLGLTWQVTVTVTRATPVGSPVALALPLLAGESVTTPGIQVENRQALIHMGPDVRTVHFQSDLALTDTISLTAPDTDAWTETWVLDAGPIRHCEATGIAPIHHQDDRGQWRPQWQPWPGEQVVIHVSRPEAIPGRIVTIDAATLEWTPGERMNKSVLALNIRTSRGGRHPIRLSDGADLQLVKIDNRLQPIRLHDTELIVPLKPGLQNIRVEWQQPSDSPVVYRGPDVHIGDEAVNADIAFHMPRKRWILWAYGPRLGPAVLFWSYLAVVLLAAAGLSRLSITPLKLHHWMLLGLGLTQVPPVGALLIVGWFLAVGIRKRRAPSEIPLYFNASQVLLFIWTAAALFVLYLAVEKGLLGIPDMQIAGNHSSNFVLHWTRDRIDGTMPRPGVLSLPLWVYHVLMLLWSLWLAMSVIRWLKWAWQCVTEGGLWKKVTLKRRKTEKDFKKI